MNDKEYVLKLLEILERSIVTGLDLPGLSHITMLNDIKPDSFRYAINTIRDYINEELDMEEVESII